MTETASVATINTDVVIIGGGVMGASIALEMSKALNTLPNWLHGCAKKASRKCLSSAVMPKCHLTTNLHCHSSKIS